MIGKQYSPKLVKRVRTNAHPRTRGGPSSTLEIGLCRDTPAWDYWWICGSVSNRTRSRCSTICDAFTPVFSAVLAIALNGIFSKENDAKSVVAISSAGSIVLLAVMVFSLSYWRLIVVVVRSDRIRSPKGHCGLCDPIPKKPAAPESRSATFTHDK